MGLARLGLDGVVYYRAVGGSSWTELKNVRDLTLTLEKAEADVTTRGNAGWRATRGTLKEASIEFQMVNDSEDAGVIALQQAWFDNEPLEFLVLDGPNTDEASQGLKATCDVFTFSRGEELENAQLIDVSLKPTYADDPPEWVNGEGAP